MDILNLRKEKNLTQVQLAKLIGASTTSVRFWEQGVTVPNAKNMKKLKEILEGKEDVQWKK